MKTTKLPKYKYLLTCRYAEIIHDLTVFFCQKYLSDLSSLGQRRTIDQMIQATSSTKQNITECVSQRTSLKGQIKLLGSAEKRFIQEGGYTENLFHKRLKILKKLNSLKTDGFTLLELLIIVALIALIAVIALITLNPKKQIEKTWDGKRKNELSQLKKVLEDWYNDKNCYPKPQEICYDSPSQISDGSYICHICGNDSNSPSFSPYLNKLPCDPQHPAKKFLYQIDNLNCPSYYRIYTRLSFHQDPSVKEVGCQYFCGPVNEPLAYNYAVTSPNTGPEGNETRTIYYCSMEGNCTLIEQNCPSNQIRICDPSYTDSNCGGSGCRNASQCRCENL